MFKTSTWIWKVSPVLSFSGHSLESMNQTGLCNFPVCGTRKLYENRRDVEIDTASKWIVGRIAKPP
jgi:hypothetical protein